MATRIIGLIDKTVPASKKEVEKPKTTKGTKTKG